MTGPDGPPLYRGMGAAALEAEYNLTARRGIDDFTAVVEDWTARTAAQRERSGARIDLAYGPGERERLDVYPAAKPGGPLLVYLHGGYWQRGDKCMYGFISEAFGRQGVTVAVLNYTLTPAIRLNRMPPQIQRALQWLWTHAAELGCSRERLHLMGHSAGAHLAAMMMASDWPALDPQLPSDLIRSGIAISGVFDLEPIVHTTLNAGPRMSIEEAKAASPLFLPMMSDAPQLVVTGGGETDEFHRQSDAYAEHLSSTSRPVERYIAPDVDHFDVLNRLAEDDSELFARSMGQLRQTS